MYYSVQTDVAKETTNFLKELYDVTKSVEKKMTIADDESLPELIVENFDEEQIWQELELQNSARLKLLTYTIQQFTKSELVLLNEYNGKYKHVNFNCCDLIDFKNYRIMYIHLAIQVICLYFK